MKNDVGCYYFKFNLTVFQFIVYYKLYILLRTIICVPILKISYRAYQNKSVFEKYRYDCMKHVIKKGSVGI